MDRLSVVGHTGNSGKPVEAYLWYSVL